MTKSEACRNESILNEGKFKKSDRSLKNHKVPGFDRRHVNAIKSVYDQIKTPLFHVFNNYFKFGIIFLEKMKLAKVTPIFKLLLKLDT